MILQVRDFYERVKQHVHPCARRSWLNSADCPLTQGGLCERPASTCAEVPWHGGCWKPVSRSSLQGALQPHVGLGEASPWSKLVLSRTRALQAVLSKVVTAAQLGGIGIMLGGEQLFAALGLEAPQLYHQYKEKKFGVIMGCWFLGNALQNQLLATGADPPARQLSCHLLEENTHRREQNRAERINFLGHA